MSNVIMWIGIVAFVVILMGFILVTFLSALRDEIYEAYNKEGSIKNESLEDWELRAELQYLKKRIELLELRLDTRGAE